MVSASSMGFVTFFVYGFFIKIHINVYLGLPLTILIGGGVYGFLALLLNSEEGKEVMGLFRRRVGV